MPNQVAHNTSVYIRISNVLCVLQYVYVHGSKCTNKMNFRKNKKRITTRRDRFYSCQRGAA